MNAITVPIDGGAPAVRPFALLRERVLPALERRRADLEKMYDPVMGRPETDPVFLVAATVLQLMQRLPDRACAEACLYDARWRLALGDIPAFHPTTLVNFRNRLAENGKARLACRTIEVTGNHMTLQERRDLCKTPEYHSRMRKRNAVEGTHSELARGYGLWRCRYKGRAKTGLQAQLTATACNLRRWARRLCWEERKKA